MDGPRQLTIFQTGGATVAVLIDGMLGTGARTVIGTSGLAPAGLFHDRLESGVVGRIQAMPRRQ